VILRLANDVTLVADSVDGIVERAGAAILHLGGQAGVLAMLASLACVPCREEVLREALLEADPVGGAGLLAQLCAASVLVPCELTARLLELHAATLGYDAKSCEPASDERQLVIEDAGRQGIDLPEPHPPAVSLEHTLALRRTARDFTGHTLSLDELATILGLSARATVPRTPGLPPAGRPYPSGGALYPIEMLVHPLTVSGVEPGFYRYQALAHRLARMAGPLPPEGLRWLLNDHSVEEASLAIFLAADFGRPSFTRYGGKAYRLLLLEAGHLAQNLLLVTAALGLAGLPLCGFRDAELTAAAGLLSTQPIVYALVLGSSRTHAS
jgi:SagB-type dehydrogenase family enzyme